MRWAFKCTFAYLYQSHKNIADYYLLKVKSFFLCLLKYYFYRDIVQYFAFMASIS